GHDEVDEHVDLRRVELLRVVLEQQPVADAGATVRLRADREALLHDLDPRRDQLADDHETAGDLAGAAARDGCAGAADGGAEADLPLPGRAAVRRRLRRETLLAGAVRIAHGERAAHAGGTDEDADIGVVALDDALRGEADADAVRSVG